MQNNFKNITVREIKRKKADKLLCYPIQYKKEKYVAEIILEHNYWHGTKALFVKLYKYKKTFLHKGKYIGLYTFVAIPLEEKRSIIVETLTVENICSKYLILILNAVFNEYEKRKENSPVYEWNGIIEDKSSSNTEVPSFETGAYINWLENMLTMLSKNYIDLVHASSEEVLKSVALPRQNETRKAIRLISENAVSTHEWVEEETIEFFTQELIKKQRKKNNR